MITDSAPSVKENTKLRSIAFGAEEQQVTTFDVDYTYYTHGVYSIYHTHYLYHTHDAYYLYDIYDGYANMLGPMARASDKPKVVKKNFTFPEEDFRLFEKIQTRLRKYNRGLNGSEVVRAGLTTLLAVPRDQFLKVVDSIVKLKPGKPPKKPNDVNR